jgi:hypothetical protein
MKGKTLLNNMANISDSNSIFIFHHESGYAMVYGMGKVPQKIINQIQSDEENTDVSELSCIVYEAQINLMTSRCSNLYFIAIYTTKDVYLGGSFLHVGDEEKSNSDPKSSRLKNVAKSVEGYKYDIKLNSLLIPATLAFLKDPLSCYDYQIDPHKLKMENKVITVPFRKQGTILRNYYGYVSYEGNPAILAKFF